MFFWDTNIEGLGFQPDRGYWCQAAGHNQDDLVGNLFGAPAGSDNQEHHDTIAGRI